MPTHTNRPQRGNGRNNTAPRPRPTAPHSGWTPVEVTVPYQEKLRSIAARQEVAFVLSDAPQQSSRWLSYVADGLRPLVKSATTCTFADLDRHAVDADVFVLEHDIIRARQSGALAKRKVVVWLDDAVWQLPLETAQKQQWDTAWLETQRLLGNVQGVVSPSLQMKHMLRALLPMRVDIRHINNFHNFDYQPAVERTSVLGWGGSAYHLTSWRDTREMWLPLLDPAQTIAIVGHTQVANLLRDAGCDVIEYPATNTYREYLDHVASWRAMVIPLHGPYDACRSWIKALEACWCDTPWFGYGDAIANVYYGVPGRVRTMHDLKTVDHATMIGWSEEQRISWHTLPWLQVLFGSAVK